ncbi:hypothetical protein K1T71_009829 [Dendrolimus kikuchii]|uniref:Uncharacterized protein n=1 Tax=Dendrolimus kikuchii TaxID=765133 RepID=A0ACC1CST7_9NEOP|nr:hypothetical protein K1T71_009829 [Dendrolimus kikuchii]
MKITFLRIFMVCIIKKFDDQNRNFVLNFHIINIMFILTITILTVATQVMGQRPSYAGISPIGFPDTPDRTTESLQDRFGEDTTPKLPIEANGDLDLIDRLSKLPIDQQPFWFINWQALEANRDKPQSYPQRPSSFVDPIPSTGNNVQNTNSQLANRNGVDSNPSAANLETPFKAYHDH